MNDGTIVLQSGLPDFVRMSIIIYGDAEKDARDPLPYLTLIPEGQQAPKSIR